MSERATEPLTGQFIKGDRMYLCRECKRPVTSGRYDGDGKLTCLPCAWEQMIAVPEKGKTEIGDE